MQMTMREGARHYHSFCGRSIFLILSSHGVLLQSVL